MDDGTILLIFFGIWLLLLIPMTAFFKVLHNKFNNIEYDPSFGFIWPVILLILIFIFLLHVFINFAVWFFDKCESFFEKIIK